MYTVFFLFYCIHEREILTALIRKVLPCINLFNDKLPDAVFKPVFNLNQHGRFSVKELQALRSFFLIMWNLYNMNDKHCRVFDCSPIITTGVNCLEAVKNIRYPWL